MTTLSSVRAPHAVTDPGKLPGLVAAYESETDVTPIVVLTWPESAPTAICGSHRLAAMWACLDGETDIEDMYDWIVTLDGEALYEALAAGEDGAEAVGYLDAMINGRGCDFGALCGALIRSGVLSEQAAAALEDQQ